ncbi:alpha/beta hydrolase [Flavobacterium branchiophilum]|uniref:Alpha/beta hydrolase n=1 Tax=Flavobacterium branchiophilum TaxID=55197 RepID=A0A2H3KKP1_9FLAO|nr:alpha/beta hydrolase [Flavobacterium branchiophilum]
MNVSNTCNTNRLVILSDINGDENNNWLQAYIDKLEPFFEIIYYNCQFLGSKNTVLINEHKDFIDYGIDHAVNTLLTLEPEKIMILGFSIGGTIGWKSVLKGLKVENLIAISATRLRYEKTKPNCKIDLYFGENDAYKPISAWYIKMNLTTNIIKNSSHECYKSEEVMQMITEELIKKVVY